jgi:hypothetical protein
VGVDGNATTVDASAGTSVGQAPVPAILFARDGLDGTRSHTFNLAFLSPGSLGGAYLELYYLEYVL